MPFYVKLIVVYFYLFCLNSSVFAAVDTLDSSETGLEIFSDQAKTQLSQRQKNILESISSSNKAVEDVIYHTLLAVQYYEIRDQQNTISDNLFELAIVEARKLNHANLLIWVNTLYGFYHYTYSDYIKALPYFLESSRRIQSFPVEKIPEANQVLIKNAYFFGTIDFDDKSIDLLQEALRLTPITSKDYGQILYAIGRIYLKTKEWDKAEDYFKKALASSSRTNDEIRYAKSLGELAIIFDHRGESEKAITYLLENITLSIKNSDPRNTMYAQIQLARLYLKIGDYNKAQHYAEQALSYAQNKIYLKGYEKEIVELQLELALKRKDSKTELELRRSLEKLDEYIAATDGEPIVNKVHLETQKERIRWQLEAEQAKSNRSSLLQWLWLSVSVLLCVIALIIKKRYKKRLKLQQTEFDNKLRAFHIDKLTSEQKLSDTHNTLDSYKVYLSNKNEQIAQLESELAKLKDNGNLNTQNQRTSLENILQSHLLTEENWFEFKKAFINEKPEEYQHIRSSIPNISESELRIILLLKMGLDNYQISHMLCVTIEAVRKSKQRMRKKYGDQIDVIL